MKNRVKSYDCFVFAVFVLIGFILRYRFGDVISNEYFAMFFVAGFVLWISSAVRYARGMNRASTLAFVWSAVAWFIFMGVILIFFWPMTHRFFSDDDVNNMIDSIGA